MRDCAAFARVRIDAAEPPLRATAAPQTPGAARDACRVAPSVVLLGSIATPKYVDVLGVGVRPLAAASRATSSGAAT
jgi:hypothetical protein